jgi:hypothetical protein
MSNHTRARRGHRLKVCETEHVGRTRVIKKSSLLNFLGEPRGEEHPVPWKRRPSSPAAPTKTYVTDGGSLLSFTQYKRLPVIAVACRKA